MDTSTLTDKGQIVLPAKLRKKYKLKKGHKVVIREAADGSGFIVQPINNAYFEQFRGMLKGKGNALKLLLEERKKDREHEDRRFR